MIKTLTPQAWRFAHAWAVCTLADTDLSNRLMMQTTLAVRHLPPSTPDDDNLAQAFVVALYCAGRAANEPSEPAARGLIEAAEQRLTLLDTAGAIQDACAASAYLASLDLGDATRQAINKARMH